MESKEFAEAATLAASIREGRPKDPVGHALLADVYVAAQLWPKALDVLEQGMRMAPDPGLVRRLHLVHLRHGKADQANAVVARWLSSYQKDVVIRRYIAENAILRKDFVTAKRYFQEILALQPKNAEDLNNLAWTLAHIKDPQALGISEQAYALAPNSAAAADTLGWLLVDQGDFGRGLPLLEKAAKLAPDAMPVRLNFARALIKAGKKDVARRELEELSSKSLRSAAQGEIKALLRQLEAS
ncbi:MAG: tetratricopeptide repeat protein [Betaproteobacteria bacterium]|nr:tetratricopeptide repeat protein [Betaproteobacteria bacterium]